MSRECARREAGEARVAATREGSARIARSIRTGRPAQIIVDDAAPADDADDRLARAVIALSQPRRRA